MTAEVDSSIRELVDNLLWSAYTQVESSLLRAKLLSDWESLEFMTDFWNPGGEPKLTEPPKS